jgi:HEAT repeat protein
MQIFIDKYAKDEESQAFIIECIGKVSHHNATDFLINTLENEKDPFLQIACIDALAINASEPAIIEELIVNLNSIDDNLKPVILKTILAISQRIEYEFNLPDNLRYIAHNAIMDDDEDLRGAGLLALGNSFIIEDVKYLFNLIRHFNPDIAEHILYILLNNSDDATVKAFLEEYSVELSREDESDSESELFAHIRDAWIDAPMERKKFFIKSIIDIAIFNNDINIIKALKILSDFDDLLLESIIEKYAGTLEPDYKNTLDDLIYFTKL